MPNWKKLITSGSDANLSSLSIQNTTTDDSLLLRSDHNSSTAAPVVTFKRNSTSPADADYLGQIKFKGENDADQETVSAKPLLNLSQSPHFEPGRRKRRVDENSF